MRKIVVIIIFNICVPIFNIGAQIITTIAGTGTYGYSGDDSLAINAKIYLPVGICFDKVGNLIFGDWFNWRIRKLDTNGFIKTIAGNGINGCLGNNVNALSVELNEVAYLQMDENKNIYVPIANCGVLKKIDTNNIITLAAGNGTVTISGDGGPATDAGVMGPGSVKFDKCGNIYFSDDCCRIRKIDTFGIIHTFAGTIQGYGGDNGPATDAQLNLPYDITFDKKGNLYIADMDNYRIRKIDTNGIITTVAGSGVSGYSGDHHPATLAKFATIEGIALDDARNLFIADFDNSVVRKIDTNGIITTVVGTGVGGYNGDSIPASAAKINGPHGLAFDKKGNLYIADAANCRIRKVTNMGVMVNEVEGVKGQVEEGYQLFPNPNNGTFTLLQLVKDNEPATVKVWNELSQCFYNQQVTFVNGGKSISLNNLTSGIYFLSLIDSKGRNYDFKFIVR